VIGYMHDTGAHIWAYKIPHPVKTLVKNPQETFIGITTLKHGRILEIHHYNLTSGDPFFMFEVQGDIMTILDCVVSEDASYVAALSSTNMTLLIKIDPNSREIVSYKL
jgi:hypothetical protein